jgi:tRNA-Thr(GGU) m(6)t(6)A37 methyltransferase TsaA
MNGQNMKIIYTTIGIVHSPFTRREGMPIQASRAKDIGGKVEVFPKFQDGLRDLEGFTHIILLYHFHKVKNYNLHVVPFLDTKKRGLFATRAPKRPNPIGLSIVRLVEIRDNVLSVLDLDVLNETPVLDIKPYVPEFDGRTEVRSGWLESVKEEKRQDLSDGRFR